jgi:uncharacterized protein (TIGR03083 family)
VVIGEALAREREAFRQTMLEVGPDVVTECGGWTSGDLAVHLALGELVAGGTTFGARALVRRGMRLDKLAGFNVGELRSARRRRDVPWALARFERPTPWLHRRGGVAEVSLVEVWCHHEDVLDGAGMVGCASGIDLEVVLGVLADYQRRVLADNGVRVSSAAGVVFDPGSGHRVAVEGGPRELARWLSGRGGVDGLTLDGEAADVAALANLRLLI